MRPTGNWQIYRELLKRKHTYAGEQISVPSMVISETCSQQSVSLFHLCCLICCNFPSQRLRPEKTIHSGSGHGCF